MIIIMLCIHCSSTPLCSLMEFNFQLHEYLFYYKYTCVCMCALRCMYNPCILKVKEKSS